MLPFYAAFWLSHKSISHEYINILFDGQKMQRDGRRVKVDQLVDYSNLTGVWGGVDFFGRFLKHAGKLPIRLSWD